jgi:hypothetical protein
METWLPAAVLSTGRTHPGWGTPCISGTSNYLPCTRHHAGNYCQQMRCGDLEDGVDGVRHVVKGGGEQLVALLLHGVERLCGLLGHSAGGIQVFCLRTLFLAHLLVLLHRLDTHSVQLM